MAGVPGALPGLWSSGTVGAGWKTGISGIRQLWWTPQRVVDWPKRRPDEGRSVWASAMTFSLKSGGVDALLVPAHHCRSA